MKPMGIAERFCASKRRVKSSFGAKRSMTTWMSMPVSCGGERGLGGGAKRHSRAGNDSIITYPRKSGQSLGGLPDTSWPGVTMKPVGEYTNYRKYLRDFYRRKKKENPSYSFRLFSRLAGFKASNMLKLVMDGQRNLTAASAGLFIKALGLQGHDAADFLNLVRRNQDRFKEKSR
jgi:hypothetical protein